MKQRLALAIALLSDPPVIVLDEPTSNLDAAGRQEVVTTLGRLRRAGKTLVFASHRSEEVGAVADRVLVLEEGRVASDTTPEALWSPAADKRIIRLHVAGDAEKRAFGVLRDAGHDVELNGNGLCVTTCDDRKGAPIGVLNRASIDVRDFEVLGAHQDREAP